MKVAMNMAVWQNQSDESPTFSRLKSDESPMESLLKVRLWFWYDCYAGRSTV